MRAPAPTAWRRLLCALALLAACGERESSTPVPAPSPAARALATPQPQPAQSTRRRALWVLCEGSQRVLEHPERVPALLADARALGATDLFVQVYRGGRAWFDSTSADTAPFQEMLRSSGGDPLRHLIAAAHGAGLRVHAWVNVLSLASHRGAPILAELGRDAVLVDRRGRSILDYPDLELPAPDREWLRMGTPAIWLDPAAPGVAARLAALFGELTARYPELDGLHLDYIRHPDVLPFVPGSRFGVGIDFGYGEATRARFLQETGLEAPGAASLANANAWDQWRRDRVTDLVRQVRDAARAARPGLELSAAVWAYPDRAYLSLLQDWPRWLDEGLLEFVVPMLYTTDTHLLRILSRAHTGIAGPRVWLGLGSWLFAGRSEQAAAQLRLVREIEAGGESLFSWDAIAESPALRDALAAEAAHVR